MLLKGHQFKRLVKRAALCATLLLSACQLAPTRVSETMRPEYGEMVAKTSKPIVLTENTVILDARSAFEFGLSHIAGSRSFSWENLAESRESGLLLTDLRKVSHRLALNGLDIHTPVVIVGSGGDLNGSDSAQASPGRLAWSLLYYGFYDVQVVNIDVFKKMLTTRASELIKNVEAKSLSPRTHLEILKPEFGQILKNLGAEAKEKTFVIDVRTEAEIKKDVMAQKYPGILKLNWTQFFNNEGRPNSKVLAKLKALDVTSADRIILISNKGVRSGAATFALVALGFGKVQNFTAGWNGLR